MGIDDWVADKPEKPYTPARLIQHKESKPQKCPACEGNGGLTPAPNYETNRDRLALIKGNYLYRCHGCDGKGWVTV